ncbi:hypothetical protein HZH66_014366 [Vespula vulgaris]|uniref:Uncharacterized protein n=1 Tax=Vespula vulgaris TaxID=7454 RepID=A0A834J6N0_VESVU|nr:hypothetical protein HZH66_014366 [Vespula vulgaris]
MNLLRNAFEASALTGAARGQGTRTEHEDEARVRDTIVKSVRREGAGTTARILLESRPILLLISETKRTGKREAMALCFAAKGRMCSRLFVAAEGTNQANGDKSPDNGIDEHRRVLDSCRCSRRFCGLP